MAREKFVVRLLNAKDELLGWAEVYAEPSPQERGASCPYWPVTGRLTKIPIDRAGNASQFTVHWCDLDVARLVSINAPLAVKPGQTADWIWLEPIWLVPGQRDVPLPPVTVRESVTISVPMGDLAARDSRVT